MIEEIPTSQKYIYLVGLFTLMGKDRTIVHRYLNDRDQYPAGIAAPGDTF